MGNRRRRGPANEPGAGAGALIAPALAASAALGFPRAQCHMPGMEDWPTGRIETVHPLVRRLLAANPSPFTYTGTQTYIVGSGDVAVIDPGPDLPDHVDALVAALAGERV